MPNSKRPVEAKTIELPYAAFIISGHGKHTQNVEPILSQKGERFDERRHALVNWQKRYFGLKQRDLLQSYCST